MGLIDNILNGLGGVPIEKSTFWTIAYPEGNQYTKFLGDGWQLEVEKKGDYYLLNIYSRGGHLEAYGTIPVSNKTKGIKFIKDFLSEAERKLKRKFTY